MSIDNPAINANIDTVGTPSDTPSEPVPDTPSETEATHVCDVCGCRFGEWPNNPSPLATEVDGCCDGCNRYVTAMRLALSRLGPLDPDSCDWQSVRMAYRTAAVLDGIAHGRVPADEELWEDCGYDPDDGDEPPCMTMLDYLRDALDVRFVVGMDRECIGGSVCLVWGGPTMWVDTMEQEVRVSWSSTVTAPLSGEAVRALDDALETLWAVTS